MRIHNGLAVPKSEWSDAVKDVQMKQLPGVDRIPEEDQEGDPW